MVAHAVLGGIRNIGWRESIDSRHFTVSEAEVSISRLRLVRRPGCPAFIRDIVVIHLLGPDKETLLFCRFSDQKSRVGQSIIALGLLIVRSVRLYRKFHRARP